MSVPRRWGQAMKAEALTACRADIETADRDQLAQDVADLLDEVSALRWNIDILISAAHA